MPNDVDFATPGISRIRISRGWLNANGLLPICIAKTPTRLDDHIIPDSVAEGTSRFAQALLAQGANGTSQVQSFFGNQPGLVVFPEYAFSSREFSGINACIRNHPTPLLVLAGCGAAPKGQIDAMLENGCQAGWKRDLPLVEHGLYNLGWCWIHESPGQTRCVLFAKNYKDQRDEITISNLQTIQSTLCIETDDLVIYPLICSDLISERPDSPRARISRSPINGKKLLVCTISCNGAPYSEWWQTAIDDVVRMDGQKAVLIFANQAVAKEECNEERDRWRCLTGAFTHRTRMPNAPRVPLPIVRYVSTPAASGLVFRQPDIGLATGHLSWEQANAGSGLYVFEPGMRFRWKNGGFLPMAESVESYETRRFVRRRQNLILQDFAESTHAPLTATLKALISPPDPTFVTPRLWPDLLDGPKATVGRCPDKMDPDRNELGSAFVVLAAIQHATSGQPVVEGKERGQIDWEGKDIRVWFSPALREAQMLAECQRLALAGGSMPPLIVVARGRSVGSSVPVQTVIPPQQAIPDRQTDISSSIPDAVSDIESPRLRQVYWQTIATIQDALIGPGDDLGSEVRAAIINQLQLV